MKKFKVLMVVLVLVCFSATVFAGSSGFGGRMEDLLNQITNVQNETSEDTDDSSALSERYQGIRNYIRDNYKTESKVTDSGLKAEITAEQYSRKNSTLKSDGAISNTLYKSGFGTNDGANINKKYTANGISGSGVSSGDWGKRYDYSASGGVETQNKYAAAGVKFDKTGGENGRFYDAKTGKRISKDEAMNRLNTKKSNMDMQIGAGITWAEKKVEGKAGLYDSIGGTTELAGGIQAKGDVGYLAGASGSAKAGIYSETSIGKDGKIHTFNGAKAGAEGFVGLQGTASGELSKQVGDVTLGLGGNAKAEVGVGGSANAVAGLEDGKLVAGVDGELFAGARAKGDVTASGEYKGVKAAVTASGNVGVGLGIGGRCKVKIGWDGISWDVGANAYLGVGGGFGVKGSLDFSKALAPVKDYVTEKAVPIIKNVASNVKEVATNVKDGVVGAAKTVTSGIANTAKSAASTVTNVAKGVSNFFKSSWF